MFTMPTIDMVATGRNILRLREATEHKFALRGVFIGHQGFYNENQIRDSLFLVLLFV